MNDTQGSGPFDEARAGTSGIAFTRRAFVIGGALAASAGVAYARQPEVAAPQVKTEEFEDWVPDNVGPWAVVSASGVVLPPPDTLRDRLYDNLATGVYAAPDAPIVMMLTAYNNEQDGVLQVHRPEVCYPVGGYDLTETEKVPLQAAGRTIPANFFTASAPNRIEHVLYYTRLGGAYPRSWAEQRIAVVRANLAGNIPDGILMRVSTIGPDRADALPALRRFADMFVSAAPPPLQRLLIA
jgi:EpsI family protein